MDLSRSEKVDIAFATIEAHIQNDQKNALWKLRSLTKELLEENASFKSEKYLCGRCRKEAIHRSEAVRADLCQSCLFALNKLLDSFMKIEAEDKS